MTIRSVVPFIHVIGVLVLFIGMAFEWASLASLRRSTTPEHASSWVTLHGVLPRVYGMAFAVLLVSGMYLARRVGVFEFAWVRRIHGFARRCSCEPPWVSLPST